MSKLRAAVIGLGMMGRNHARVLTSLEGVDLVAVADPANSAQDAIIGPSIFSSVDDVLAAEIDYAVVAVPTAYHLEVGLQLAQAGVHALIEKPLADSTESAEMLADAFEKAGLVGATGHIERYNPSLQSARKRLAAGDLGEVYQIATRRQGPFPGRISDVGVVKDLATHDIDLTMWVTQRNFQSVAGQTAHRSGREHEDLVAFVGLLDGDIVTNHLVNWMSPLKERITIITGERGTYVANTLTADLTFYANGTVNSEWSTLARFRGVSEGEILRYAIAKPEPLLTEHQEFRNAVLGKSADIVTLRQGTRVVEVAEAVLASAATAKTVTFPVA